MSGLEVVGAISGVITLVEGTSKTWDIVQREVKFSRTIQIVAGKIPILRETLQICQKNLQQFTSSISADLDMVLTGEVEACEEKLAIIIKIFEGTIPGPDDKLFERYGRRVRSLGKGRRVEELMKEIYQHLRDLINLNIVKSTNPVLSDEWQKSISELESLDTSVAQNVQTGSAFNSFNSAGGPQAISTGSGDNYVVSGGIGQHSGSGPVIFGPAPQLVPRTKKCGLRLGTKLQVGECLFQGRSKELDKLALELLVSSTSAERRCVVLGGLGGIGKTQLALAFAERYGSVYDSTIWLNATNESTLKSSFRKIAPAIFAGSKFDSFTDEEIIVGVCKWLSNPENTNWLLIFDNFDDPQSYRIEEDYYPSASHGSILVTTRFPAQVNGVCHELGPLDNIDDGIAILRSRSKRVVVASDSDAYSLAKRLAGLPLALATAGAFLKDHLYTFQQYLDEYDRRWEVNQFMPTELPEYQNRTLYTTWNLSYTYLQTHIPEAAELLKLLAYFDNQDLWYELFTAGQGRGVLPCLSQVARDSNRFHSLMNVLTRYCFIEVQQVTQTYSMHNCVHDWTLMGLNPTISMISYSYAFDCVTRSTLANAQKQLWRPQHATIAQHAGRLMHSHFLEAESQASFIEGRYHDAYLLATLLREQLVMPAGERMLRQVVVACEKVLGPEHNLTLSALGDMARMLVGAHSLEQDDRPVRETSARSISQFYLDIATSFFSHEKLDRYDQAERIYARLLAVEAPSLDRDLQAKTFNDLGQLYRCQHRYAEAEKMFVRSLLTSQPAVSLDSGPTSASSLDPDSLDRDPSKLEQAELMYLRAATEKDLDQSWKCDRLLHLGMLLMDQEKYSLAEQMFLRALAGHEKVLGPDHDSTLKVVFNLAVLYDSQGKAKHSKRMHMRILAAAKRLEGPPRLVTLLTLQMLRNEYEYQDMSEMIELVSAYDHIDRALNDRLGRILLFYKDDTNAQYAFKHRIGHHEALQSAWCFCDRCKQSILGSDCRFVCRNCDSTDLCGNCWTAFRADRGRMKACEKHEFFEMSPVIDSLGKCRWFLNEEKRRSWLYNLKKFYDLKARLVFLITNLTRLIVLVFSLSFLYILYGRWKLEW